MFEFGVALRFPPYQSKTLRAVRRPVEKEGPGRCVSGGARSTVKLLGNRPLRDLSCRVVRRAKREGRSIHLAVIRKEPGSLCIWVW